MIEDTFSFCASSPCLSCFNSLVCVLGSHTCIAMNMFEGLVGNLAKPDFTKLACSLETEKLISS